MKKIVFNLLLMFVLTSVGAQDHLPVPQDYKDFLKTKTLVVMDENPMSDFNFMIKKVMPSVWNLTDYEFISQSEFEEKRRDASYSFIVTSTVTFDRDKTKARYTFVSLLMGKDVYSITDMPDLCSIPLSYLRVEDDSYAYKMEGFIRFIQDHVKLVNKDPKIISRNMFKYYNKNIKSLSNKKLLVVKEDLAPDANTISKIQKVYPYTVEIVTQEEVTKAIQDKDPDVVFLHKVGPEGTRYKARCYKIIIGAADSQFYYFDWHMVNLKNRDGLLLKDFKAMGKK
ncbi:hypothetical protein [Saccharicrinis fermentans]|uniref:Uncharacterized protein n=1 Tax=Saccharicrinis fermentans DSM 9555 = JCM 21142 TaxID=869213 RepID=W7XZU4_9BACT|nr:hypothetical protein [Saccharicrinis fermentans]GAF04175.1 hypothetical protein JCM21142_72872 [Saccharicrinis fermentans DSM 9555 = JCM 21142]